MNSRLSVLSLALLSMVSVLAPGRVVAASSEPSAVRMRVVIVDARLRSAFIQRATGFDRSPPPATFAARQRELREHFDAVLALLVENTARSLDTALDRLEWRRGEEWSEDERATWRQRLSKERLTNIQRLHRYQRRGRFPINEHATNRAVPVFVDNYDTACAVGHLMRESGWEKEVAAIQAEHNLVYVTDVNEGPLVDWIATSGLTQGEAALIQPAYEVYPGPEMEVQFGSVPAESRGIVYSNFRTRDEVSYAIELAAFEWYSAHPSPYLLKPVVPLPNNLEAKIRYGGGVTEFGVRYQPYFDRWLTVGELSLRAYENEFLFFGYEFELSAADDSARIDAVTVLSNIVASHGWVSSSGQCLVGLEAFDAAGLQLGEELYELNSPGGIARDRKVLSIPSQKQVKVRVSIFAHDGVDIGRFGHEFNLVSVPEPSCMAMLITVGCILLSRGRTNLSSR